MSLRVEVRAILELLAENKSESAQLYRRFAAVHELGDLFFEAMAENCDEMRDVFLALAKQARVDGSWVVEESELPHAADVVLVLVGQEHGFKNVAFAFYKLKEQVRF